MTWRIQDSHPVVPDLHSCLPQWSCDRDDFVFIERQKINGLIIKFYDDGMAFRDKRFYKKYSRKREQYQQREKNLVGYRCTMQEFS
jgi:hypothetical protein